MNKKNIFALLSIFFQLIYTGAEAQSFSNPLSFPMQLSGAFGDLRSHHFHAGIDMRTKRSTGHVLRSVRPGYVSRISVSPRGYGHALYITHPQDSLVTVYGHLQKFSYRIAEIVKARQYKNESFSIDFNPEPDALPLRRGDIIGYSGNSGSSGGPHLHFEVRDMRTNEPLDPLVYYKSHIPDTRKPLIRDLMIYPIQGKGVVNGKSNKQKIKFRLDANDTPVIKTPIEAWGEIGLGIKAVDRMNGTGFSYGIKDILQTVDGVETFRSTPERLSFQETRYINSYTDYEEWSNRRGFYIKTFIDPGNKLRFLASRNSGRINIDEERIYNVEITMRDLYGNATKATLKINGKKQEIPPPDTVGTSLLRWYEANTFYTGRIKLQIDENSLYTNIYMHYDSIPSTKYYSAIHKLHKYPVPLHNYAQLSIRTDKLSVPTDTNKYGIIRIAANGRVSWKGGTYREGWIETKIRELGNYTVACDITPPVIKPVNPAKWNKQRRINIRITDDLSGIASFRGEIDDRFALFEYDAKNAMLTYKFDDERIRGGYDRLKLVVKDGCSNESVYEYSF